MAGIYVHFPFCSSKCIYCDFYSRVRRDWDGYVDALVREAGERKDFFKGVPPSTLYFGGGTPSILPIHQLGRVVRAVSEFLPGGTVWEEFTVECNPDDVTVAKAEGLRCLGANRISMGVQSFVDAHLAWMKRRHTASGAEDSFHILRRAGFDNISIDLIFGYVGLSDSQWKYSLDRALSLHPEHISCYQMMGRYSSEDEEACSRQYILLHDMLQEAGYEHYEISNFALPGHRSRHNSSYWTRESYLGLGAAAHSFDGDRVRSWNVPDIIQYESGACQGSETLSDEEILEERIMLGLRTSEGVERSLLDEATVSRLIGEGLLAAKEKCVRIAPAHFLVSDNIVRQLI